MAEKKKAEGGSASGKKKIEKAEAADQAAVKEAVVPEIPVEPPPQTKSTKIPKLASKNKSRLPRREKKARQKGN